MVPSAEGEGGANKKKEGEGRPREYIHPHMNVQYPTIKSERDFNCKKHLVGEK